MNFLIQFKFLNLFFIKFFDYFFKINIKYFKELKKIKRKSEKFVKLRDS